MSREDAIPADERDPKGAVFLVREKLLVLGRFRNRVDSEQVYASLFHGVGF